MHMQVRKLALVHIMHMQARISAYYGLMRARVNVHVSKLMRACTFMHAKACINDWLKKSD